MNRLRVAVLAGMVLLTAPIEPGFAQSAAPAAAQKPTPATGAITKPVVVSAPVAAPAPATATADAASDSGIRVLLTPTQETTLASPVTARITRFDVSLGSTFAAGQTLIEFDCEEPIARVNMAKAELSGAVETHEAKVRMQGLDQASDVEVALAASAVAKARAQIALHGAQVKQCFVLAPWAGRISKVHVQRHMSVNPGQPMVDLVMSGPLKLRLNMPSSMVSKVRPGYVFDVKIDETGQSYKARITAINSRVDAVSQTIEAEAMMASQYPGLLAGMSGTARLGAR